MTKKKLVKSKKLVGRRVTSREARQKHMEEHLERTEQAQVLDDNLDAPIAPTTTHWEKDPNRWDIPGVDSRVDWRHVDEKKRLKMLEEGTIRPTIFESMSKLEEEKLRLQWQKKHPFILGVEADFSHGEKFDGIGQYQWALRENEKFGFDLQRPEKDFLDTYNLKQYDIYGLKFIPLPDKSMNLRGAAGFYASDYKVMALPPIDPFDKDVRERTIRHEIGHHIYDHTSNLQHNWKSIAADNDTKVTVTPVIKSGTLSGVLWFRVSDKPKKMPIGKVILEQEEIMAATMIHRDINTHWKYHYQRRGARGSILTNLLYNEAFAECFRTYRSGEMKRQYKRMKEQREVAAGEIAQWQKKIDVLEKRKKTGLTVSEQHDLDYAYDQQLGWQQRWDAHNALVGNHKAILDWFKEADSKGWYQGRGRGEVKFTTKHIRPVEFKERDYMMYEADIGALKISKKNQHQFDKTTNVVNEGIPEADFNG